MRMRRNSLDLNSFRADFCSLSMNSSPFKSITSSLIWSVVLVLISFNSSSFLAIMTTDEDGDEFFNRKFDVLRVRTGHRCWILTPVKEDLVRAILGGKVRFVGEAMEMPNNIFAF